MSLVKEGRFITVVRPPLPCPSVAAAPRTGRGESVTGSVFLELPPPP